MTKLVLVSSLSATPAVALGSPGWGEKEALTVLSDGARPPADRLRAAERLHKLGALTSVAPMIALLERIGEDRALTAAVQKAVIALGGAGQLAAQLAAEPEVATRAAAALSLGRVGGEQARAALRAAATGDAAAVVRRNALNALAIEARPEDVELARTALGDADAEVRQSAAMVLGASGGSRAEARAALVAARAAEKDPFVTYFYDQAIKRLDRAAH